MRKILFNNNSRIARLVFKKMLTILDHPQRQKINNPHRILQAAVLQTGQKVLEIGCGSGFFTMHVAPMIGDQGILTSIDIHPAAVAETKKKVSRLGLKNVTVMQADAENTRLDSSQFDVILLLGVIPAPVISIKRLIIEMHRLLIDNGKLVIWTAVPLWRKISITKSKLFKFIKTENNVHIYSKV